MKDFVKQFILAFLPFLYRILEPSIPQFWNILFTNEQTNDQTNEKTMIIQDHEESNIIKYILSLIPYMIIGILLWITLQRNSSNSKAESFARAEISLDQTPNTFINQRTINNYTNVSSRYNFYNLMTEKHWKQYLDYVHSKKND